MICTWRLNTIRTSSLDNDSKLIYDYIKEAKNEGIWTKDLKKRTNLHLNVVNRVLKFLEQKQLVKSVKHVKVSLICVLCLVEL